MAIKLTSSGVFRLMGDPDDLSVSAERFSRQQFYYALDRLTYLLEMDDFFTFCRFAKKASHPNFERRDRRLHHFAMACVGMSAKEISDMINCDGIDR